MKTCLSLLFLCSLTLSASAQGPLAPAGFDETLTFDDNLVPAGWAITFPYGPGRNALVENQRFEIHAVDTYAALEKSERLPGGSKQIHIAFRCVVKDVNPGMGYQIHLVMKDASLFIVGLGKTGYGVNLMNAYAGNSAALEFYQTYAPDYGTYILDGVFEDGQITLTATRVKNGRVFASAVVPVAGLKIGQLRTIRLFGIMTTGHDSSPAWIDDALIEALP